MPPKKRGAAAAKTRASEKIEDEVKEPAAKRQKLDEEEKQLNHNSNKANAKGNNVGGFTALAKEH